MKEKFTQLTSYKVNDVLGFPYQAGAVHEICEEKKDFNYPAGWHAYKVKDVKKNKLLFSVYKNIKQNFDLERNWYDDDLLFTEENYDKTLIWYLFFPKFEEARKTNNTKCVGIAITDENYPNILTLSMIWIHPYVRNKGMAKILMKYNLIDNLMTLAPPVDKSMVKIIEKLTEELPDELQEKHLKIIKSCFEDKYSIDLSKYEKSIQMRIINFIGLMTNMIDNEKIKENIEYFLTICTNEKFFDEMIKEFGGKKEWNIEEFNEIRNEIYNIKQKEKYGSLPSN